MSATPEIAHHCEAFMDDNAPATRHDVVRIEGKVDQLTNAMTNLIRVEERQSNMSGRIDLLDGRIEANEKEVQAVKTKVDKWVNRGVGAWAVAATLFALVKLYLEAASK